MGKETAKRRYGRLVGGILGAVLALLVVLGLIRGAGVLMLGGIGMLREAGDMAAEEEYALSATPVPTMPPLEEEVYAGGGDEGMLMEDPVELPVEQTPEQLAQTAPDLTPPPDAPVG